MQVSVSWGNAEMMAAMTLEAGQVERRDTKPSCLAKDKMYQGNYFCLNLSQKFQNINYQITKTFHQNEEEGELIGQVLPLGYYSVNQGVLMLAGIFHPGAWGS